MQYLSLFGYFGILSYLSITFFYILTIFKKLTGIKEEKELSYSLTSIIFALALIPNNTSSMQFIENYVYKYFSLILIFGISMLILFLAYFRSKRQAKI